MNAGDFGGLKVLMISSDRNILASGSAVSGRMKEYGELVDELHIVLLSNSSHGLKDTQLSRNVWVYATNSFASFLRPLGAANLGKRIVYERKFVRGRSVITADSIECGWAGLKIKRKWRIPLEVQFHTNPFSPYFKGFQNIVRRAHLKKILRHADYIRVVTEDLKSQIAVHTKAPVTVLPIYVDRERIKGARVIFDVHARFGWHFIMLSVARLSPEKNLSLALEVLARARSKFPDTGLIIVGSGPEEGSLKSKVKSLKLERNVAFEGWQDNLASYYKTSNLYIQTSLFEGYGLSLVEAGISGLPIVTTSVGIARELEHGKDAFIYLLNSTRDKPHGDPEPFAAGVLELIENNFKRESLRVNIQRTLESKLLSKGDYMAKIKENWEKTASKVRINE